MNVRPLFIASLLAAATSAAGCTATLATMKIVKANKAISAAVDDGAEAMAPYELTLAVSYRDKALEQFADSEHGDAMDLADMAKLTAGLAQAKATGRPLGDEGLDEELTEGTRVMPDAPEESPATEDTDPLADAFEAPDEAEPAPWESEDDDEATP